MTEASDADRNAKVRALLAERNDSGRTPRHTLFFFYGGELEQLAKAASEAGYVIRITNRPRGLILEAITAVDERSFQRHAQQMQAWADEFASEYDGWECRLVTQ